MRRDPSVISHGKQRSGGLDDVKAQAVEWCERARRLGEAHTGSAAASLATRLDLVAGGLLLRRQLDSSWQSEDVEKTRRELLQVLTELQLGADSLMASLVCGTELHEVVARRSREWLDDVKAELRTVTSAAASDPMHQALAIEGLRNELEWHSAVIDRVDRETPDPATVWLDVELARLSTSLRPAAGRDPDPSDLPLRTSCERLQSILLARRIKSELAWSSDRAASEALWGHRFHLTRLQARAMTPALASAQGGVDSRLALERAEWVGGLDLRRAELAGAAEERMSSLGLCDRVAAGQRIVQLALDEMGETMAFLEDMSLSRAVDRLKLVGDDLARLAESCREWPRIEHRRRDPSNFPDEISLPSPGSTAGARAEDAADLGEAPADIVERERLSRNELEEQDNVARERLRAQALAVGRASRQVQREWQEKLLALRMEKLLGRRFVAILENTVLFLILVLLGLIAAEALLERASAPGLSASEHLFFAWADLAVCSVFLFEFAIKLVLAPHRTSYFLRHFLVDLLASLPFGFVAHQIELAWMDDLAGSSAGGSGSLWRPARIARVARAFRFLRVTLPIARLARVGLILLRLSDRLVRRMGKLLNRNIVLFEPLQAQKPESSDRHRLIAIRGDLEHARSSVAARLDREQARRLSERCLGDLERRIESLPEATLARDSAEPSGREIPVEAVVERLIQMTPERLVEQMGRASVTAIYRYIRLLDLPLLRRLPFVRRLVAYREKSPSEAVALAANYLGHSIQRALDLVYFFADLHGTLSPPVFLDRLGVTIVNATRTPAKRLLWLGSAFLFLFLIVNSLAFLKPFRTVVDKVQTLLGWPVIILGVVCLVFWLLGAWFRKIANQSADYCERVVEAQFATHTKTLKSRRRDQDSEFLSRRVINPEMLLRTSDDRPVHLDGPGHDEEGGRGGPDWFENRELAFLRNVRLLYLDYLDGSPLHRSDTKASVQLLGNLALTNLRRSHLGHLLREGRTIDRLDLNRAGGLFGGPYLWFNYITRMLVQETALLLLDYNRHAVPLDRLACSPPSARKKFRYWLANRLKIDADEVWVPELSTPHAVSEGSAAHRVRPADRSRGVRGVVEGLARKEAGAFLETVEFTAVDFLADDPERDCEIHARFGPQVAELVRRDRQQNVRRAFRSFPLHELPLTARTINPFAFYEAHLSGARIALLPLSFLRGFGRAIAVGLRSVFRGVHEILDPQVDRQQIVPADTYLAALRKIHRMRKPVFMGSLWLRARFDVEYMGLRLPTAPESLAGELLMEADLDYIGATRRDRIIAEQFRRGHQKRLEWVGRWLDRFGWTFELLPNYLAEQIPYLANRGGEALRALVAACVLDHDDIATLALSIEGLKGVMEHASDGRRDPRKLPPKLPDPIVNLRTLWHPVNRRSKRPLSDLFELPCFPSYGPLERRRIVAYLRRHRRATRGWMKVVLGQGSRDPWAVVQARMRDVLLRTDLWSDQILVLRAVQTLTMLDLQHNCALVWNLGGYTHTEQAGFEPSPGPPRAENRAEDGGRKAADGGQRTEDGGRMIEATV
jgi:hypothetical protein